ncbi:hypothetical protein AAFF_G00428650 [Aldrovandia affinis]|uniref:Gap junction protein n=1 Tax=Aldrovandia affinis TaxID=143900 RepID=A0AAD7WIV7_9TELE|nr:hypothetical protein AAFF_G00428650 [Aldrovandia affinis]
MARQAQGPSWDMRAPVRGVARARAELLRVARLGGSVVLRRDMTEWTLLKRLLDAVHQHSTMIGRLWLTVMVIFRLLVVAVATEDVYTDEQERFVCDTLQPGCANVCYDAFAPISQPRFWVFQIISVSTPSLCFIVYTWHNLSKRPEEEEEEEEEEEGEGGERVVLRETGEPPCARSCDSDSCSVKSHRHLGHSLADVLEGIYYVFHVCFRATLEVGFVVGQWLLFGFRVPAHYVCASSPCPQRVNCYVSRPTEKTVFLVFMFCVGVFCVFLNLLELNHLGWKKIRGSVRGRRGGRGGAAWRRYEALERDGPSLASLTLRDAGSTSSLPTLDLVVEHRPDWTCAGSCPRAGDGTASQHPRPEERTLPRAKATRRGAPNREVPRSGFKGSPVFKQGHWCDCNVPFCDG